MGHNVTSWEMIRTREEKSNFDIFDGTDGTEVQHTIMNNMVDARACYKPSGKVSVEFKPLNTNLKWDNFDEILINQCTVQCSEIVFLQRKIYLCIHNLSFYSHLFLYSLLLYLSIIIIYINKITWIELLILVCSNPLRVLTLSWR